MGQWVISVPCNLAAKRGLGHWFQLWVILACGEGAGKAAVQVGALNGFLEDGAGMKARLPSHPVVLQHWPLPPDNQVLRSPVTNAALLVNFLNLQILIYAYAKNKLCPGLTECVVLSGRCTGTLFLGKRE